MSDTDLHPVPEAWANSAHINADKYHEMYQASVNDPEAFWGEHGKRIDWIKPYTKVKNTSFEYEDVSIKWYEDGLLNVSANCIDRHLATRGNQTAIIWEADSPDTPAKHITYQELHTRVSKFANVLKHMGVGKGDRTIIYMPMIPEAAYAMLACARIGAIHSIVFAGFSPDALGARVNGCQAKVVITADHAPRGGRKTKLKDNVNQALLNVMNDVKTLVVKRTGAQVAWRDGLDFWYHEEVAKVSADCPPEEMNAEDPLFILYTSGSTGQPKGVRHVHSAMQVTCETYGAQVLGITEADTVFSAAKLFFAYGLGNGLSFPMSVGAKAVLYNARPTPQAVSDILANHQPTIFCGVPTLYAALLNTWEAGQTHPAAPLRTCISAGEALPAAIQALEDAK